MMTIGKRFREERSKRSLSLDEVAQRTKIRKLYLEKLERDEFEGLPQEVYTRGFVRNLARLYGLEENETIDLYEQTRHPEPSVSQDQEGARAGTKAPKHPAVEPTAEQIVHRKSRLWLSGLLMCLLLAVLLVYGWRAQWFGSPASDPVENQPSLEEPAEEPAPEPEPTLPQEEPPSEEPDVYEAYDYRYITPVRPEEALDIMVQMDADAGSRCWVSVLADGREEFTGTLVEGDIIRVFARQTVQLTLGDAGVVTLYRDGKEVGLDAQDGDVVYRDFIKE